MINSLKITNIKSFEEARLPLAGFTVLLGANAAGKSNVRDTLRFLHGVGRGYRLLEILGGKYEGGDMVWRPLRGGPFAFVRQSAGTGSLEAVIDSLDYHVALQALGKEAPRVCDEWLNDGEAPLFSTRDRKGLKPPMDPRFTKVYIKPGGNQKKAHVVDCQTDEPILSQIPYLYGNRKDDSIRQVQDGVAQVTDALLNMRFLDLQPDAMRLPSYPGEAVLGDRGENLSSVLQSLTSDEGRKSSIIEWLKVLTPMDVADLTFVDSGQDKVGLVLVEENGSRVNAESASDGTLRFLAYLALAFSTETSTTCFVEELDNGIHPSRIQLLVELLESRTSEGRLQVIASSHSPALVNYLSDESRQNSLLLYRNPDEQSSRISPLKEIAGLEEAVKKRAPGALFESGWFEDTAAAMASEGLA